MKKIIFCILIILLFGLIISNQNNTYNKKYINYNKNWFIEYPHFTNQKINQNLTNYIDSNIKNDDYLFIDYDYINNNTLTMYVYKETNNIATSTTKVFIINQKTKTSTPNIQYDFLNSKLINKDKLIALTFDDGPNHNTIKVLNILEKYNIKATFFVLGINISGNEKIISRMNNLKMEIGNHMYSHSLITKLSTEKIQEEITKTDELVYNIIGKYPTLIRPSYGIYNQKLEKNINRPLILWNIDTLDWKYHNSTAIATKVFNNINHGNIILMHDIYNATANSLEIIIPKLLNEGYEFVTVSELFT